MGFYIALVLSLLSTVYAISVAGMQGARVAAIAGLLTWPHFAVGIKHRSGERPDAKDHPLPTFRRPWSRASDRWLIWTMWTSAAGTICIFFFFFAGMLGLALALLALVAGVDVVVTTWMERKRRLSSH